MDQVETSEALWNAEDQAWLERVKPEVLQAVAKRHGRTLFALVWQTEMIQGALNVMVQNAEGISKWGMQRQAEGLMQVAQVLSSAADQMCKTALAGHGLALEQFAECKQDIERAMALAQGAKGPKDRVSKGGIILDS
jgi:hypothetical protein